MKILSLITRLHAVQGLEERKSYRFGTTFRESIMTEFSFWLNSPFKRFMIHIQLLRCFYLQPMISIYSGNRKGIRHASRSPFNV